MVFRIIFFLLLFLGVSTSLRSQCNIFLSDTSYMDVCDSVEHPYTLNIQPLYLGAYTYDSVTAINDDDYTYFTFDVNTGNSSDLISDPAEIKVCIQMEHSYAGDLEIALMSPDSTIVGLLNSYSGPNGFLPGGSSMGGTYLGQPEDNNIGNPGICWEYCFVDSSNYGPLDNMAPTTPVMNPSNGNSVNEGIYRPDSSFNKFMGDTLNGTWTIIFKDNLGIDDGFLCGYSVEFGSNINQPYSVQWVPGAGVTTVSNSEFLLNAGQSTFYQVVVYDSINACYDTAYVNMNVYPTPQPDIVGTNTPTAYDTVMYSTSGYPGSSYQWNCGNCYFIGTSQDSIANVQFPSWVNNDTLIVEVIGPTGCIGHDTMIINIQPIGIDENEINNIKAYPNPGNGLIKFNPDLNISAYRVFDISGRVLEDNNVGNHANINVKQLPVGTYIIWVKLEDDLILSFRYLKVE